MRLRPAALGVALSVLSLSMGGPVMARAEERVSATTAAARATAIESSLTARLTQVAQRYSYEAVHRTFVKAARAQGQDLARSARPLATRTYALWAAVVRRVESELDRLRASRAVIIGQTFVGARDVEWLEHAGSRIQHELEVAEGCLDQLVVQAIRVEVQRAQAKALRADLKRRRATLSRLPGKQSEDPLAEMVRDLTYRDLAAGSARATADTLQEALSDLATKQWMPVLEPQAQRRQITLNGAELPPALVVTKPQDAWVPGVSTGVLLARSIAESAHRHALASLTGDAELAALERITDTRDALDKSLVRSLQVKGLALARRAQKLSAGLERLPELRSVVVFANGKAIFEARRPSASALKLLIDEVLRKSGALNEMLGAVLLLRRQFVFHAIAAERGRGLRATGEPVDIRSTIQKVFKSSRAAHALDRSHKAELERFYKRGHYTLAEPQHLRDAVQRFLTDTAASLPPGGVAPKADTIRKASAPDAEATLTVARLLAKLSDDRAHVPLRAAKRVIRRWDFPVPGYPERPSDALQVLADDLTAWVHLPAAVWSETAFQQLRQSLQADMTKLRDWTTRHRATDGLAMGKSVVLRDGMHIEVVVALNAEHEGALEVELAGDVLAGDGIYLADTPGLLFSTPRLNIGAPDAVKTALIRLSLP